jgi:riboflavin kinase/FMN adenylyltransferase
MIIKNSIEEVSNIPKVVTIGNFDGIHKGHQSLINKTCEIASENHLESLVFTFDQLPEEIFNKNNFKRLYSNSLKSEHIRSFGIDTLLSIDFNSMRDLSATYFCEEILLKRLNVKYLVIGDNFKFGKGREGTIKMLREYEQFNDFNVIIPKLEKYKNENISSTRIRELINDGKFGDVENCLGRKYMIEGMVSHGEKLGRKLGYPTANISLDYDYPLDGIYLSKVFLNDQRYFALSSVGNKPTYNGKIKLLEVFIFDFDKDIYGKKIKVSFLEFIRKQIKFSNEDALIKQMNEDHKYAIINSKNYGI